MNGPADNTRAITDAAEEFVATLGDFPAAVSIKAAKTDIHLRPELSAFLVWVVERIAAGDNISFRPQPSVLSTAEAAHQLGVSRPTMVKMARRGEIPFHEAGSHMRFQATDVLVFEEQRRNDRMEAFDDLRKIDARLGEEPE
jgi:excisionase family DNA binding protein